MEFNVLKNAIISNSLVLSGTRYTIQPDQLVTLLGGDGVVSVTGNKTISLMIDMGYSTSLSQINYLGTNLNGNLEIYYGQLSDDLVSDSISFFPGVATVYPTLSGYSPPRYIKVVHSIPSGVVSEVSGLGAINTVSEVDFGVTGDLNSITITQPPSSDLSEVYEIPIYNNTNLPADIYTSLDTFGLSAEEVERVKLSTTVTGEFISSDLTRQVPNSVPWEWGIFSDTAIVNNELWINTQSYKSQSYVTDTYYSLTSPSSSSYGNQPIEVILPDGSSVVAITDSNNNIVFVDPLTGTRIYTSGSVTPSDDYYRRHRNLAWDGHDRIYYIDNAADRVVRYFELSTMTHKSLGTISLYARAGRFIEYHQGSLYIGGLRTTSGTSTGLGVSFIKLEVETLTETSLMNVPYSLSDSTSCGLHCVAMDDALYLSTYAAVITGGSKRRLLRYRFSSNTWTELPMFSNSPSGQNLRAIEALFYSKEYNALFYVLEDSDTTFSDYSRYIVKYNISTDSYASQIFYDNIFSSHTNSIQAGGVGVLFVRDSTVMFMQRFDSNFGAAAGFRILNKPYVESRVSTTVSGSYLSPVFRLTSGDLSYKFLLDYTALSGSSISSDNNINCSNFQVRGSDQSPTADCMVERFLSLDGEVYNSDSLPHSNVFTNQGQLIFDHDYIDDTSTPYNSAFITFGFPLNTAGVMQYKFWWNPPSGKTNNSNTSKFYIAPFLDFFGTSQFASRNSSTKDRLSSPNDDYIYIKFGQTTDTTSLTALTIYNGSSSTNHSISARSGGFYEIIWIIDWNANTYSLYFDTKLVGTGTISSIRAALLKPSHTFEFFSGNVGSDSREMFRELTISRIGNMVSSEEVTSIPVHRSDPLYGITGTLAWYPVTVDNPILPMTNYCQLKVNLITSQYLDSVKLKKIIFPVTLKLQEVPPSGSKSIFMQYEFPEYNELWTKALKLRSWMLGDK